MTTIGKMYGVSDNAIRKRCKRLEIDITTKRKKNIYTENSVKII
jgi:hypothetical protein